MSEFVEIQWEGDSKLVVRSFPESVRQDLGAGLRMLQSGLLPDWSRRMVSVGPGVFELKTYDERSWYRLLYLSKIGNTIYVLHAFEKKSAKTEKRDLEVAKKRLQSVLGIIRRRRL